MGVGEIIFLLVLFFSFGLSSILLFTFIRKYLKSDIFLLEGGDYVNKKENPFLFWLCVFVFLIIALGLSLLAVGTLFFIFTRL